MEDQLGIVTYSDAAEVKLPLTAMNAAGKAAAEAALQTLRADGQTNLWQEKMAEIGRSFLEWDLIIIFL